MSSIEQALTTPLHGWHSENSGRMVEFAGWSMPIQYSSIVDEHNFTRNAVGLFDVSHMGRLWFQGADVAAALDGLTTRRVAGVAAGKIRYSLLTNEGGGILDDVLVYHLENADGPFHMMVVNASNRDKIVQWLEARLDSSVRVDDRTQSTAMIAVQGPKANAQVAQLITLDPDTLGYYEGAAAKYSSTDIIVSRTGYTGEDGCELIVPADSAVEIWERLMELAKTAGGGACGLAARDTLRLEAAMPLYGHELSEQFNAGQTSLNFAINAKDREFVGKAPILAAKKDDSLRIRVGFELKGKRAARENVPVVVDGNVVGEVTSGTFGPTVQKSISMGYIDRKFSEPGTQVQFDIRGKIHQGVVVKMPFYKRNS